MPPAPVRVPSQRPLAPCVPSVVNDNSDNKMIPGAVQRSPGIYLKDPKTSARRAFDEGAVRLVIASNGVPFLQMRSVESYSTSGMEKKGKMERIGSVNNISESQNTIKIIRFIYKIFPGVVLNRFNFV